MNAMFRWGAVAWAIVSFWGLFVIIRSVMAMTGPDPLGATSMATITFVIIWLMAGTISAFGGLTFAKLAYDLLLIPSHSGERVDARETSAAR